MLSETLSGKCPCCSYDKLLQRYGSSGYFHMDGCPNCGFGYGQGQGEEVFGEEAFLDYGVHILTSNHVRNDSQEEYDKWKNELSALSNLEKRKMIFEWAEKQERCNDVENTVFKYSEEDVKKHLSTNPVIFKLKINTK